MVRKEIPALKVNQWLPEWNKIKWNPKEYQAEPERFFYLFSISATDLKGLSGVRRRPKEDGIGRQGAQNIQRGHNSLRSEEIKTFVKYGFPLSSVSKDQQIDPGNRILQKPGWLPTAIVVNILKKGDKRDQRAINPKDIIHIEEVDGVIKLIFPENFSGLNWEPQLDSWRPIEVIDGQHRLWAFEKVDEKELENFDLPVVAFHGLDISWQAYLFWMINIKPVKINSSLAFDLYPLLRKEEWLERFSGPRVYREIRAQELIEIMYSHPASVWFERIDMLGKYRQVMVSQTSWINSLLSSYIKEAKGTSKRVGGLYGAPRNQDELLIPWSLNQQAAFLIYIWNSFYNDVKECDYKWAEELRKHKQPNFLEKEIDIAFAGSETIINTDQGVRGFLYITNDLFYLASQKDKFDLINLFSDEQVEENVFEQDDTFVINKEIENWIQVIENNTSIDEFTKKLMEKMSAFDWRSSKAEGLSEEQKLRKLALRGSGGYKELRRQLLIHLSEGNDYVGVLSKDVHSIMGY